MGEVLADAGLELHEILGRRVVAGDVLPVLERPVDVLADGADLLADRGPVAVADGAVGRPQRGREPDRATEVEEVAQRIGQRRKWRPVGQRRHRRPGRVRLHERAGDHLDPVVELRDREVMREVVVPVAIPEHARRRPHRQLEGGDGLARGRLGLDAQFEKRLADVGVVLEGEAVLDLEEHQVTKYRAASASWTLLSSPDTRSRSPA